MAKAVTLLSGLKRITVYRLGGFSVNTTTQMIKSIVLVNNVKDKCGEYPLRVLAFFVLPKHYLNFFQYEN